MIFKRISILLTVAFALGQSPAGEPVRAGIDVPEPKLIRKVGIDCPNAWSISSVFPVSGPAVLNILIDEQGVVADVTTQAYQWPEFLQPAISAVKQWHFLPTYLNGRAVPVAATAVILFLYDYIYLPSFSLEARGIRPITNGTSCRFPVTMNHEGDLKEMPDPEDKPVFEKRLSDGTLQKITHKETCAGQKRKEYWLIPTSDAPFSSIERRLQLQEPLTKYTLQIPQYRFPDSGYIAYEHPGLKRLYYTTLLVSSGSQLIQLAGVDPTVKPPKLKIDFSHLVESLKDDSGYKNGAIHFFTVFVDDKGIILGVAKQYANETVLSALSNATVLAPGTRNGKPVPTAVIVAIPVK
jgi:hypothetical protein